MGVAECVRKTDLGWMTEDSPQMWPTVKQRCRWAEIALIHPEKLQTEVFSEGFSTEEPIRLLFSFDKSKQAALKNHKRRQRCRCCGCFVKFGWNF